MYWTCPQRCDAARCLMRAEYEETDTSSRNGVKQARIGPCFWCKSARDGGSRCTPPGAQACIEIASRRGQSAAPKGEFVYAVDERLVMCVMRDTYASDGLYTR